MATKLPKNWKCIDCGSDLKKLKNEFPELDYIACDGCPRVYDKEVD